MIKEENSNKVRKFIHVLKFTKENNQAKIGRGSEADIKVIHSTVSRIHASIYMKNNKIFLTDLKSKFGT